MDGKNFSERIWGNRQKLVNELNNILTQNIILGKDPQKAIDELTKKMNTSKTNAGRLVMTEEAFFSSVAQKDCLAELDVKMYEIVANLDSHTSDICRGMDGKHFPMSQWEVGVTDPPFHVWCRSTTVPYFDDDFDLVGERAARGEDGKTYYVPADMTYREWEKAFVDSNGGLSAKIGGNGIPLHKESVLLKSNVKDVNAKIKKYEVNAMKETTETALIYTKERELFKCFGVEGKVFPDFDLCDKLLGATISHNHPMSVTEYSFSDDDIELSGFVRCRIAGFLWCKKTEELLYELVSDAGEMQDFQLWMQEFQGFNKSFEEQVDEAKN